MYDKVEVIEKKDENVLTFPCYLLDRIGRFQGFDSHINDYINECFRPEAMEFRPRSECETNFEYKQVIPYCIIRFHDLGQPKGSRLEYKYFTYTRTKLQGESRLHGLKSIGIGGHVSDEDCQNFASYDGFMEGMYRELDEEVSIDEKTGQHIWPLGCINDDDSEVGKVHFGVVYLCEVTNMRVSAKEKEGMFEAGFRSVDEILSDLDSYEEWSKIVIDHLMIQGQGNGLAGQVDKHGEWKVG